MAVGWVRDHLSTYEPIEYAPRKESIADEDVRGEMGWREGTIYDTDPLVDEAEQLLESGRAVMFQTSCSYMLNSLLGNLRRKHIPFSNPWRKYRRDWNPLGQSCKGLAMLARLLAFVRPCHDNPHKAPWTIKDVAKFTDPMSAKGVLRRGAKKRIEGLGEADSEEEVEPGQGLLIEERGDDPFGGPIDDEGTSPTTHHYTTTDPEPQAGRWYYRLRQTDFDGSASFSRLISVDVPESLFRSLYPNPGTGEVINLSVPAGDVGKTAVVWVADSRGRQLFQSTQFTVTSRDIRVPLATPLGAGVYVVSIALENQIKRFKWVVR